MLTLHVITVLRFPHFIIVLNVRNNKSMSNVLEMLKWAHCFFNIGHAAGAFYMQLAYLVSLWKGSLYSCVKSWLHYKISFSFAITCLQGVWSSRVVQLILGHFDLALTEGQVSPN